MTVIEGAGKGRNLVVTRWLFLRMLGLIHFSAFASLGTQIIPLFGSFGLEPASLVLSSALQWYGSDAFMHVPSVFWLGVTDVGLQAACTAGIVLSVAVVLGVLTGPALFGLYTLWLSLIAIGGDFTIFQSDSMLAEVTFISLFFAPWQIFEPPWPVPPKLKQQAPPAMPAVWLLWFTVFRFMFASGLLKLIEGGPTWRDLTALDYFFETQAMPTPFAWYAHQLPGWVHKIGVLLVYISELLVPIAIFCGRRFRLIAAGVIASFQVAIALFGNFSFLNFLCILLCVPLLDDLLVTRILPASLTNSIRASMVEPSANRLNQLSSLVYKAVIAMLFVMTVSQLFFAIAKPILPASISGALKAESALRVPAFYGFYNFMETKRPELVFEGSMDGKKWLTFTFKQNIGRELTRQSSFIAPHMPRLDWLLLYAARDRVEDNRWILNLSRRLLYGSRGMKDFLAKDPFPVEPPKQLRILVFNYRFTTPSEHAQSGRWWERSYDRVYVDPMVIRNGQLERAVYGTHQKYKPDLTDE